MTDMRTETKPRIALVHTTPLVMPPVESALAPLKAKYDFFHTLDEAILYNMMKGSISGEETASWLQELVNQAVRGDARAVIVSCSSLSPYVLPVHEASTIPVIRIDEMMYRTVAGQSENPAVLMTNPTNKTPAALLARETEKRCGLDHEISVNLCPGAFEALQRGETERHDQSVILEVEKLLESHDALIFSQISMARVRSALGREQQSRVHVSLDYLEDILAEALNS